MVALGIVSGLTAAFTQSLSYLTTRHFVQRRPPGASRQLLVLGHIWMGLFSLILLCLTWPAGGIPLTRIADPLLQMAGFYLLGQIGTTFALRHAEPSRVSPLLGFKIVFLALLASFFQQPHASTDPAPPPGLTWLQWTAVFLCVAAAISLNYSGARLRRRALLGILIACITYSLSDWNIARTNVAIHELTGVSSLQTAFLSAGLCYAFCGLIALAFLPATHTRSLRDWTDSIPFALAWFGAMIFLYWCFATVGPLLGNILQSTRGLISILMASLLIYLGHLHIEPVSTKGIFVRRLAAGLLMFFAVTLYVIKDPAHLKMILNVGSVHAAGRNMPVDAYHELLTTRYVCEACLTKYFVRYSRCPACHQHGYIQPLHGDLYRAACDDDELRSIIANGQQMTPAELRAMAAFDPEI